MTRALHDVEVIVRKSTATVLDEIAELVFEPRCVPWARVDVGEHHDRPRITTEVCGLRNISLMHFKKTKMAQTS